MFKKLTVCCLFVCFYIVGVNAVENEPEPKITFTKMNDNFWVLHGGNGLGANVGMSVGDDGILLIDAMVEKHSQKLIEAIRSISDKPIKYVINTHQHGDHRGGNEALVALGATLIYPNYLKYASSRNTRYAGAESEIQFQEKMSLKFNNEEFELYHVKSHTWNDVIVHMKNNNAIFTGDNHATSWGPNIGVRGLRGHREVFDLIYQLANEKTTIVPGHTKLADLKQVRDYDKNVLRWFEIIKQLHKEGVPAKSIIENKEIRDLMSWFHGGKFPAWLKVERQIARVSGTIFSIEETNIELTNRQLQSYLGTYRLDNGELVEVFNYRNEIYVFKDKTFTAYLLAKTPLRFGFNGWNENEEIEFILDKAGEPTELRFSVNGKLVFNAKKIETLAEVKQ